MKVKELKDYTDDELRSELKRRAAEKKAEREAIPRCRHCKHYGSVTYWGVERTEEERIKTSYLNNHCKFCPTKDGKHYYTIPSSRRACEF